MYLCYVDESGNRDPRLQIPQKDGSTKAGDWLYVVTALCIFEQKWHTLEKPINRFKQAIMARIERESGIKLTLADAEVKSYWVRQPKERADRLFFANMQPDELTRLTELYFAQLSAVNATLFSVLVDKRTLAGGVTQDDIHVASWEKLLELVQRFMIGKHPKHQAIMINDDVSREMNRMLAMTHARLLDKGTTNNTWLRNICEMPMFVRSELSVGVQLADLCSYNIYRAFKSGDLAYPYFARLAPYLWGPHDAVMRGPRFNGIHVLNGSTSELIPLVRQFEREQALAKETRA